MGEHTPHSPAFLVHVLPPFLLIWTLGAQSSAPRPGGRGEELELPTGQETLTALRAGEGGGEGVGGMGGYGEEGRMWKFL